MFLYMLRNIKCFFDNCAVSEENVKSGASHLSVIPNICYSAVFQLAGGNCLQKKLAGSLCQLAERFTKLSLLAVGDLFLNSQTSKFAGIRRAHCVCGN